MNIVIKKSLGMHCTEYGRPSHARVDIHLYMFVLIASYSTTQAVQMHKSREYSESMV